MLSSDYTVMKVVWETEASAVCFERSIEAIAIKGNEDRVVVAKLVAKPLNLGIIQVYAPTSDSEDEEVKKFYKEIEKAKGYLKSQDIIIVMGDFNAKVGDERVKDVVGPTSIWTVNERGSRLIEWWIEIEKNRLHPHSETIPTRRQNIEITAGSRL
ncbi:craniofacial development protein 2-like protein [Plakobranchus ocellatus]|uniref:Craniofacial development protein 2-like protein n=1 Tax=Plakobranchus ocellatus TaxID=259542 RepID=A0AAV4AHH0_9GAST|nr:craniofacial development protein 2-like protein [Plakobranchus ocellatus]